MAVAQSIFPLNGWLQLFWANFDMALTFLALKIAIGLEKNIFRYFKKIITKGHLTVTCLVILLMPKNQFP